MTRLVLAAQSGWGKSYMAQTVTERNIRPLDGGETAVQGSADGHAYAIILDFKDEFRGLVSAKHGPQVARYWQAGERELEHFRPENYRRLIKQNQNVVLARRNSLTAEDWREICADAILASRNLAQDTGESVLVVIDEAHFVAPQQGGYPDAIKGLATTGRGEGASSLWVTQRLAEFDETPVTQSDARFLGGFNSNDLDKVAKAVEYQEDVHRAGGYEMAGLPEALRGPDGEQVTVRVEKDADDNVTGSEWIYSDSTGAMNRLNSNRYDPVTEHVGRQGNNLDVGLDE